MLAQGSREHVGLSSLGAFQMRQGQGTEQSAIPEPVLSWCWDELTSRCPVQPVQHLAYSWFIHDLQQPKHKGPVPC